MIKEFHEFREEFNGCLRELNRDKELKTNLFEFISQTMRVSFIQYVIGFFLDETIKFVLSKEKKTEFDRWYSVSEIVEYIRNKLEDQNIQYHSIQNALNCLEEAGILSMIDARRDKPPKSIERMLYNYKRRKSNFRGGKCYRLNLWYLLVIRCYCDFLRYKDTDLLPTKEGEILMNMRMKAKHGYVN